MKNKRHEAILRLIETQDIETQEELARLLKENGFSITQATVSRDIKELRLIKTLSEKGVYKYSLAEKNTAQSLSVFMRMFAETVTSIETSGTFIIIKTLPGSANAAVEAVDSLKWPEIVGTLAGDNTIFIAIRDGANISEIVRKLKRLSK